MRKSSTRRVIEGRRSDSDRRQLVATTRSERRLNDSRRYDSRRTDRERRI